MRILGTNFFGHDSAICLIDTARREIVAESTERATRVKHDAGSIAPAIQACGIAAVDVACHGYTTIDASPSFERLRLDRLAQQRPGAAGAEDEHQTRMDSTAHLLRLFAHAPLTVMRYLGGRIAAAMAGPEGDSATLDPAKLRRALKTMGVPCDDVRLYDHHRCHAAAAYYFSPHAANARAMVFTIDGDGDGNFSTLHVFEGRTQRTIGTSRTLRIETAAGPDDVSIGLIYARFLDALKHAGLSEEGHITALAAYGVADPDLYRELRACVAVTGERFEFDAARAKPFADIPALTTRARRIGAENFAATVQSWLEDIVVEHLSAARVALGVDRLCMAGGVAANVAMNLRVFERAGFTDIYVFPAMGDEGVAAGSAVLRALDAGEDVSWLAGIAMPYFGHRVTGEEIEMALRDQESLTAENLGEAWTESAARAIAQDKVIAVVQGRMEYGPRALGNRSILANPASAAIRDRINREVKRRPLYQPCCPSILEEERERLFEASVSHKHMAIAFRMKPEFRALLPGAVHVDGTARAQFVEQRDNPALYALLRRLKELTGFGVAINTSFNRHGRAIVRSAADALADFRDCGVDELYMEGRRVTRN